MPETVLFETEQSQTREEIATYLRTVADRLEAGGSITLRAGEESETLEVPDRVTFEVKAEREGPTEGQGERSVEFELEWEEGSGTGESGGGHLEIE